MKFEVAITLICLQLAAMVWVPGNGQGGSVNQMRLIKVAQAIGERLKLEFEAATNFSILQEVYANVSTPLRLMKVNGSEIVNNVADSLSQYFQTVGDALKNMTLVTEQLYLRNNNTGCCSSPECLNPSLNPFLNPFDNIYICRNCCNVCSDVCSNICPKPPVGTPSGDGVNYQNPQLNFYRARVEEGEGAEDSYDPQMYTPVSLGNVLGFGVPVSLNNSALHFSLDIHQRDPRVLCFAEWSENLTSHYIQQRKQLMQEQLRAELLYFGSSFSPLRFYPASDWILLNRCHRCPMKVVDTYDSRSRPWYVNTVPGAKFLVIIMDSSGSVDGYRLLLAKIVAQRLLLSLSQNDYFLVLQVGEMQQLKSCFSNKTRASPINVLTMNQVIENITTDEGRTQKFDDVMKTALAALDSEPECHKVIAVLTDDDAYLSDYNLVENIERTNVSMNVRVFVFIVGLRHRDAVPLLLGDKEVVKTATRNSGGDFYEIEHYEDIMPTLKEFTECLRALTPLNSSRTQIFWNSYRSVYGGISLSASQPLYTQAEDTAPTFVGVSGVDVDIGGIKELFLQHEFGVLGYAFMVDNNGQLVTHPLINSTYIKNISGDDLLYLDVSRFEHAQNKSEFEEIRRSMLDRERGSATIAAWVPLRGGKMFQLMNVTYFYAPVDGSPFSIALVLPVPMDIPDPPPLDVGSLPSDIDTHNTAYFINNNNRPICNGLPSPTNAREFLEELIETLKDNTSDSTIANCQPHLYEQLLLDLTLANSTLTRFAKLRARDEDPSENDNVVIVQFSSGLSACYPMDPFSRESSTQIKDHMTPIPSFCRDGDLESYHYLYDALLHRDVAHHEDNSTLSYHRNEGSSDVVVITSLERNGSMHSIPFSGILGTVHSGANLNKILSEVVKETLLSNSSSLESGNIFYLLGERMEIIASTNTMESGDLLGVHHPLLLCELINMGVYEVESIVGMEVRPCADIFRPTTDCTNSSALSISKGIVLWAVSGVQWILSGGLWTSIRLAFISMQTSLWRLVLASENECPVRLCEKRIQFYQRTNVSVGLNGTLTCSGSSSGSGDSVGGVGAGNHTSSYWVVSVPGTNLLLLEIRNSCNHRNRSTTCWSREPLEPIDCPCHCNEVNCTSQDVYRRPLEEEPCFSNETRTLYSSVSYSSDPPQYLILLFFIVLSFHS